MVQNHSLRAYHVIARKGDKCVLQLSPGNYSTKVQSIQKLRQSSIQIDKRLYVKYQFIPAGITGILESNQQEGNGCFCVDLLNSLDSKMLINASLCIDLLFKNHIYDG